MDEATAVLPGERPGRTASPITLTPEILCEKYAARVFKFAQLISQDGIAAEDLAQDALERAIRGLGSYDPRKGGIDGWLWRIVVNASRDAGRLARREQLLLQQLVDRWVARPAPIEVVDLRTDEVLAAVRALSPRHRSVIALRFGADLTHRDVGRALGISEAAALMATQRALTILRRLLSQGAGQHA